MRSLIPILLAGLVAVMAAPAAAQQPVGEPGSGKKLAAEYCVGCHRIEVPPEPRSVAVGPDFAAVAATPTTTVLALRVFLETPHGVMPRYQFTRDEIDDIIAYIVGLAPKK